MFEPQGPLPPEIYWRRRALALGVLAVVVATIAGLIYWAASGGDKPKNTSDSAALPVPTLPSASSSLPAYGDDYGTGGYGGGGGAGSVSASMTPSVVVGADGLATTVPAPAPVAAGAPVAGGGGAVAPPLPTPEPVPASGLCPDQNISVVLYTDKAAYQVGDKPKFTIVVTNVGLDQCTRDVGKAMQNVTVQTLDGLHYIWSANDCGAVPGVNNQVLKPGQQFKDDIVWSGTTSAPGCNIQRVAVGPGSYQAVGILGEKRSVPITFNVVAASPQQSPGA